MTKNNNSDSDAQFDRWLDELLDLESESRQQRMAEIARLDPGVAKRLNELLHAEEKFNQVAQSIQDQMQQLNMSAIEAHTNQAGDRLGAWRLMEKIGAGGMGEVWKAERADGQFEKIVAIKLLELALRRSVLLERFNRERQILARLQHSHIAPLLDAGISTTGTPYLVMEFVDGREIHHAVAQDKLGWRAIVELILQACDALSFAHAHLIVHRDLKPNNILINRDRQLKLLDFGIAKLIDSESGQSRATELTINSGPTYTPAYAAPEQKLGRSVSAATDVYSLATVLYELLTDKRPSQEGKILRVNDCRALLDRAPVPRDLDVVLQHALRIEPSARYPNMDAFARDLRACLALQPISVRANSSMYVLRQFIRRNRYAILVSGIVMSTLFVGAWLYISQARETAMQRDLAQIERDIARTSADQLESALEFSTLMLGELGELGDGQGALLQKELLIRGERLLKTEVPTKSGMRIQNAEVLAALHAKARDAKSSSAMFASILAGDYGEVPGVMRTKLECNYAESLTQLGDYPAAAKLFDAVFATQANQKNSTQSTSTQLLFAQCQMRQASMLTRSGKEFDGMRLRELAIKKIIQLAGFESLDSARAHNDLGVGYYSAGEFEKSFDAANTGLKILDKLGLDRSYDAAIMLGGLAINAERLGRVRDSENYHREGLALALAHAGSPGTLATRQINYGRLLLTLERFGEAEKLLQAGLALIEAKQGLANLQYLSGAQALAIVSANLKKFDSANQWLQAARVSSSAQKRDQHPSRGMLELTAGSIAMAKKEWLTAQSLASKAAQILLEGDQSTKRGACAAILLQADALLAQQNQDAASELLKQYAELLGEVYASDATAKAGWQLRLLESKFVEAKLIEQDQLYRQLADNYGESHSLSLRAQEWVKK